MTSAPLRATLSAAFVFASIAVLAGCSSTSVSTGSGGGSTGGGSTSGGSNASDKCPVVKDLEYFSDPVITKVPEKGQVFGDGTTMDLAGPPEVLAQYKVY
ncbi:MAG: hypothetical protein JWO10_934 [Microbacteriaceae bacterium]|nr:hypothetical protein [Microbacteriaceae bacterium]